MIARYNGEILDENDQTHFKLVGACAGHPGFSFYRPIPPYTGCRHVATGKNSTSSVGFGCEFRHFVSQGTLSGTDSAGALRSPAIESYGISDGGPRLSGRYNKCRRGLDSH